MLRALASVGGVGYASGGARRCGHRQARSCAEGRDPLLKRSPAIDQYKKPTKKKVKAKKKGKGAKGKVKARSRPPLTG